MGTGDAVVVVPHLADQHPGQTAAPHRQALHAAAPLFGALDHDAELGVLQVAVPDPDILNPAADLAANADAMAKAAAAVKHPNPPGGTVDAVSLGVFARLDGHRIVLGVEGAAKEGAVLAGIRVPAVAVPDALGAEGAVIGDNVPAVNHVDIPAGAVGQGQARNPHMGAVAQVDEPAPDPAGDGILIFAGLDQVLHGGQFLFHPLPLRGNGPPGQIVSAAADGALAPDADILAVGPGGMIQRAKVQQAGIAHHFGTLKAARDAGFIILRPGRPLQDGVLVQPDFQMAVAKQGAGAIDARREIDIFLRAAGVQNPLQGGGVVGFAVPYRAPGLCRHIQRPLFSLCHNLDAPHRAHLDGIAGEGRQALEGEMGFIGAAAEHAVQQDFIPLGRLGRKVPVQGHAVGPGQGIKIRHKSAPFLTLQSAFHSNCRGLYTTDSV